MLIPISILLLKINKWNPVISVANNNQNFLSFDDVRITYEGQKDYYKNTLYIIDSMPELSQVKDCTFISLPGCDFSSDSNTVISLNYPDSKDELCLFISRIIHDITAWSERLNIALINDCDIQTLIDISEEFVVNPLVIFDSGFGCIACSKSITEKDVFYYDVKIHGRPSAETISTLQKNNQNRHFTYGKFICGINYRISSGPTNETELFADFEKDDSFVMGVSLRFSRLPMSEGTIDLFGILVEKMQLFYNRKKVSEKNTGEISFKEFLFPLLLKGDRNAIELAQTFAPFQSDYMLITANNTMTRALANEIRDIFPDSYLFSYNQIYYIFVSVELFDMTSIYYIHNIEQSLATIGSKFLVQFGVSGPVKGYKWLDTACQQALHALELKDKSLAIKDSSEYSNYVLLYRNIALLDMVTYFQTNHPFSCFAPLTFLTMREHDIQNHTDYCSFVKTHILNGCNINKTAHQLFLHKNSVIYRLEKLKERYGLDLDDVYNQFLFLLACMSDNIESPEALPKEANYDHEM